MKKPGRGASIHPARDAARAADRARTPYYFAPMTAAPAGSGSALVGAAVPVAHQAEGWEFGTDQDGNLTASYRGGPPKILATADEDQDEEGKP